MNHGYFFIVTGKKYRDEISISFKQLRSLTKLPICVASDQQLEFKCDHFIHIPNPTFSYQDKVLNLEKTPFQKTVYVDSDISFFHCPDELFDGLAGADLLASHEASLGLGHVSQKVQVTNVFPEVSSGLIAFRKNDRVMKLLENWRYEYDWAHAKFGIREDQPSFRRALFATDLKFSILPPEFHYIPANFMRVVGTKVYCIHNHDFGFADKIGNALNRRPLGDYSAYVDGLGVFRNPYAMTFTEIFRFNLRCLRLLPYLLLRAGYIAIKNGYYRKT